MSLDESIKLKGFIVPAGYTLLIEKDGEIVVKDSGEASGGPYSYSDVFEGNVPTWRLQPKEFEQEYTVLKAPPEVYDVLEGIRQAGGEGLFVGGIVRDALLGIDSKDVDIEVYGLPAEQLQSVLSEYGEVDAVGRSFDVLKLTTENGDYDFSLPRRERKVGEGHTGFDVEPDPTMTPKEAALRRDYTINGIVVTPRG